MSTLVNPEMNIPKEASDIHGITNDKVDSMPTFKQIAKDIYSFIKDSDLARIFRNNYIEKCKILELIFILLYNNPLLNRGLF